MRSDRSGRAAEDHECPNLLWHPRFGDVPRYATPAAAHAAGEARERAQAMAAESASGIPLELIGLVTVYTREGLIEAVYRNGVAQLCDAVPDLLVAKPPHEALRAWTRLFLDYVTAKLGMADALRSIAATGQNPYGHSRDMIQAAITTLMDAHAQPPERSAPISVRPT